MRQNVSRVYHLEVAWLPYKTLMPPTRVTGLLQEALTLVWLLLIATVVLTYFIQRYKVTAIPPSSAAMTLGILCGGVVKLAGIALHMLEWN